MFRNTRAPKTMIMGVPDKVRYIKCPMIFNGKGLLKFPIQITVTCIAILCINRLRTGLY